MVFETVVHNLKPILISVPNSTIPNPMCYYPQFRKNEVGVELEAVEVLSSMR